MGNCAIHQKCETEVIEVVENLTCQNSEGAFRQPFAKVFLQFRNTHRKTSLNIGNEIFKNRLLYRAPMVAASKNDQ